MSNKMGNKMDNKMDNNVNIETVSTEAGPDAEEQIRRMSRRSFLWAAAAVAVVVTAREWLIHQPVSDGIPGPLRKAFQFNQKIAQRIFSSHRLSPEFPTGQAVEPRPNGTIGLEGDFDPNDFKVKVEGAHSATETVEITLDQIKRLPKHDVITELRCIEGWSEVVHWTGAKLSDFIAAFPPAAADGKAPVKLADRTDLPPYVAMETPDGAYYVGLDIESALHPQTLLCYEMNGQPLTGEHGAPLRLAIPVKYGIKNIKRIGLIRYTTVQPKDYWAEQGYDWYAGH